MQHDRQLLNNYKHSISNINLTCFEIPYELKYIKRLTLIRLDFLLFSRKERKLITKENEIKQKKCKCREGKINAF